MTTYSMVFFYRGEANQNKLHCVMNILCHLILLDSDEYVKKNVATLIREIAKHTPEVLSNFFYRLYQYKV